MDVACTYYPLRFIPQNMDLPCTFYPLGFFPQNMDVPCTLYPLGFFPQKFLSLSTGFGLMTCWSCLFVHTFCILSKLHLVWLFQTIEDTFKLSRKDLLNFELECLVALEFCLHVPDREVFPHYQRLLYNSWPPATAQSDQVEQQQKVCVHMCVGLYFLHNFHKHFCLCIQLL